MTAVNASTITPPLFATAAVGITGLGQLGIPRDCVGSVGDHVETVRDYVGPVRDCVGSVGDPVGSVKRITLGQFGITLSQLGIILGLEIVVSVGDRVSVGDYAGSVGENITISIRWDYVPAFAEAARNIIMIRWNSRLPRYLPGDDPLGFHLW